MTSRRSETSSPIFVRAALHVPAFGSSAGDPYLHLSVGVTTVEQAERALIEKTLEYTAQNKTRAAEILGISQKTLFNKLREYAAPGA